MGLVSQVFDESHLGVAAGPPRRSATPATPPPAPSVWENAQPTFRATATGSIALGHNGNLTNTRELAELVDELPDDRGELPLPGSTRPALNERHRPVTALLASHPDLLARGGGPRGAAAGQGRLLARLHGRDDALRRARPAGHPPAGARPAGARLGRRLRDRGAGHRRRGVRPRGRAGRAHRHRRARPAHLSASPRPSPRAACSSTSTWPVPTPRIAGRSVHATRVEIGRRLAVEAPGRGRPGHPGARVRHPGRGRLQRRPPASRSARAWSRTPTSAGPSSSRRRRSASSASGSSSTRCATSSTASGWSSSTTRSSAATPSARWSGCCARPAPPRCTCASPRRR